MAVLGGCTKGVTIGGVYVIYIKPNVRGLQGLNFNFDTPLGYNRGVHQDNTTWRGVYKLYYTNVTGLQGLIFHFDTPLGCLGGCTMGVTLRGVYINFIKLNLRGFQGLTFHFYTPLGC